MDQKRQLRLLLCGVCPGKWESWGRMRMVPLWWEKYRRW